MSALYNDSDPEICAWVEELIRQKLIAPGDVWCRDIQDIRPDEISKYTQFHAFCGVGVWSYALRNAGWDDDRPVWTGSCPCQPFSAAGKGAGFADERHLWPSWFYLISQYRPGVVFGEQVESDDSMPWLDLVWTDMEALGYAFGPVVLPAAGFGAPHGRHRIYFVADSVSDGSGGRRSGEAGGATAGVQGTDGERERIWVNFGPSSRLVVPAVAFAGGERWERWQGAADWSEPDGSSPRRSEGIDEPFGLCETGDGNRWPSQVNGFWRDADWLRGRDGKWWPVRPGTFPLVDGAPARVVRLRGYGNALCAPQAEAFIRAYLETTNR